MHNKTLQFFSLSFLITLILIVMLAVISGCRRSDDETSESVTEGRPSPSTITMAARSDFSCSRGWKGRDGALGLKAHTGNGICHAGFPGESGNYRVTLTIQTEFDGQPKYYVAINGQQIYSGRYPLSSSLGCDCPLDDWRSVCPDRNETVNLGQHYLKKGDEVLFYGEESWDCGDHGAYAKWHKITFEPL